MIIFFPVQLCGRSVEWQIYLARTQAKHDSRMTFMRSGYSARDLAHFLCWPLLEHSAFQAS